MTIDLSLDNLYRQYYACRRNKRNTMNALRFEAQQEKELLALQHSLLNRTYQPTRSVCFFSTRPKLREIFAADFRDRVVHHLLVDYLEQIWEPIFIHDSYACRKGKGVHRGVKRLQQFIRQSTSNGTQPAYYLQLDIRNYFMTIDKDILYGLLSAKLKDENALWLTKILVYHDCTQNHIFRGRDLTGRIPPHKTLFGCGDNKGLPIGNLNSQFFANVYLTGMDHLIKHQLKCRHYLRYCDDFVLLAKEPDQLLEWKSQIEDYLQEHRQLQLNPRQPLASVSNGLDFLGYIVRRDYMLVRRRVVNHLKEQLRDYESLLVEERDRTTVYRFDRTLLDKLSAMLSSYLGHFKLASCWNLWQSIWNKFAFLRQYFEFDADNWKLIRKYTVPKNFQRVSQQYGYFKWRFPEDVVFFRVGRFYEFYHFSDRNIAQKLGLVRMKQNRRGARFGFPVRLAMEKAKAILDWEKSVLFIEEQPSLITKIFQREAVCRLVWC